MVKLSSYLSLTFGKTEIFWQTLGHGQNGPSRMLSAKGTKTNFFLLYTNSLGTYDTGHSNMCEASTDAEA